MSNLSLGKIYSRKTVAILMVFITIIYITFGANTSFADSSGKPTTVTGLNASSSASSVTLSWNKNSTADSYEIDMYKDGKWIYVAKIPGTSYTVSGLSANTSYDFKVFSFKGSQYSSSASVKATTAASSGKPTTVTGLKASASASSVTLSWDRNSTADSYEIDMYKNGKWTYVTKISGTSYTVSGLSANTSYIFKVFSFKGSQYSSSASLKATTAASSGKPTTVTGLNASASSSSVTLSWNKNSTADSYEIDMYKDGKWIYVTKMSGTSYTVSGLSANTSYDFKVFSFKGSQYSSSASVKAKTSAALSDKPTTVTGLKANASASSITLSWNKNSTADSYEIDMYKDGKWIYVAKIPGTSYTVNGLSANTSYIFKVFSFKGSQYSSSASVTAKTAQSDVSENLNRLLKEYPDGSHFTKDGKACTTHSGCDYTISCNCMNFNNAIQCVGFAKYVYYNLRGKKWSADDQTTVNLYNPSGAELKNVLLGKPSGTYIYTLYGGGHALAVTNTTPEGITVYEANSSRYDLCGVRYTYYDWDSFAKRCVALVSYTC